jgi:hypothetical protein
VKKGSIKSSITELCFFFGLLGYGGRAYLQPKFTDRWFFVMEEAVL